MIPPLGLLAVTLALFVLVAALGYQAGARLAPWADYLAICKLTHTATYNQQRREMRAAAMAWGAIMGVAVAVATGSVMWLVMP